MGVMDDDSGESIRTIWQVQEDVSQRYRVWDEVGRSRELISETC